MPGLEQAELFQSARPEPARRVFLGWDRPLLDLATEFLATGLGDDLSAALIVVPTRQSGRRLNDSLRKAKIEAPQIVTPEFLYSPAANSEPPVASAADTLLAWTRTLQNTQISRLRNLFPIEPPDRSFGWAMSTAADLLRLRASLGEAALLIADVPERLGERFGDTPRWQELSRIETEAGERLAAAGLDDAAGTRKTLALSPHLPDHIEEIVLIGLPDPPGIALSALENLCATKNIQAAVYAPESEAARFDPWGRPTEEGWGRSAIEIPEPERSIKVAGSPAEQGAAVAELVASHQSPDGMVAVAVADAELLPHIEAQMLAGGVPAFLPGGTPFHSHELHAVLRLLADLLHGGSFASAAELARHPGMLALAAASYQPDAEAEDAEQFDAADALSGLDQIAADHLPALLAETPAPYKNGPARRLLALLKTWFSRLSIEPAAQVVPEFLAALFAGREFDLARASDTAFASAATTLTKSLEAAAPGGGGRAQNTEVIEFALAVLREQPLATARATDAIDLQGWLEMLWEDAPHLVIAGANDGKLPESMGGDAFLPNKARKHLGLRDSTDRLVRDSYLLSAMLAGRTDGGRVDFVLGRQSASGDPLRPSRLLLRCADHELPARALELCSPSGESAAAAPPWRAAWKLTPADPVEPSKLDSQISVTGFRSHLACPFRHYLKFGLGMEEVETGKLEMNARDFGNICHLALERFGLDESLRDSTDAGEIADFLIANLESEAHRRYGRQLPVPVEFQLESAKARLSWAATRQAEERAAGWRIVDTEWKIHDDHDWRIGGLSVRGTIDRIERHETSGAWRVLDYKTSAKPKPPEKAHLSGLGTDKSEDDFPAWATFDPGSGIQRWTDLQLPLYVTALRELRSSENITAGYFNLAASAGETKIATWDSLDEAGLDSAKGCAVGVAESICNHRFWPPNPSPTYDDFASLFFDDPEALVDPSKLNLGAKA